MYKKPIVFFKGEKMMRLLLFMGGLFYWISENRLLTALFTIDAGVMIAVLLYFQISGAFLAAPVCIAFVLPCFLLIDRIINRR